MKFTHLKLLTVAVLGLLMLGVWLHGAESATKPEDNAIGQPQQPGFDPAISVVGELAPNSLGLPGEWITWVITVINAGGSPGQDIVISDSLRNELRVDSVEASYGTFEIDDRTVKFKIPVLNPGESVQMRINTTVLRGPEDGVLTNQVLLSGTGPNGDVTDNAVAEVPVPTILPATGFPPDDDLPGKGEPSVLVVALGSFAVVLLAAYVVWRRGQRFA
jgi:uncharacterized repeat protein (TIGR01451 family)